MSDGNLIRKWATAIAFVLLGLWSVAEPVRSWGTDSSNSMLAGVGAVVLGYAGLRSPERTAAAASIFSLVVSTVTLFFLAGGGLGPPFLSGSFLTAAVFLARAATRRRWPSRLRFAINAIAMVFLIYLFGFLHMLLITPGLL